LQAYQVTKTGDKGMPDYTVAKDFKVVWNHRQDAKASPNSTFSASVNFSTSSYERSNINNLYNSQLLTQNTKTSSIITEGLTCKYLNSVKVALIGIL